MPQSGFNPSLYLDQLEEKTQRLVSLLKDFTDIKPDIYASPDRHFRYRAEFRFWHHDNTADFAMFAKGDKNTPLFLNRFPEGSALMNRLMPELKAAILENTALKHKLFQVEFLTSTKDQCLVTLIYHRPLDADWLTAATALEKQLDIRIVGRSRKQKVVVSQDYIEESFKVANREYTYRHLENSFTQPNAYLNQSMLNWADRQLTGSNDDLLELYCGSGNFTLPIARHFRKVLATEISKPAIKTAIINQEKNGIGNIRLVRLSSEEFTAAYEGKRSFRRLKEASVDLEDYRFGTVLVDPPRAGLDRGSLQLVSRFDHILYISCNPETLCQNLAALTQTHRISSLALFDQFPYTSHIETGVFLIKKSFTDSL